MLSISRESFVKWREIHTCMFCVVRGCFFVCVTHTMYVLIFHCFSCFPKERFRDSTGKEGGVILITLGRDRPGRSHIFSYRCHFAEGFPRTEGSADVVPLGTFGEREGWYLF